MSSRGQRRQELLARSREATRAIRSGYLAGAEGEHSEAIFATSSYEFDDAAQAARRFSGEAPGNVYSRYTNPTVRAFEERLAQLEEAPAAVAVSSGMAAILCTLMGLLNSGDHVICSRSVFGSTIGLLRKHLGRFALQHSFVPLEELSAWQQALRPNTRMLFLETPSNPLNEIADLPALARLARDNHCLLVVDNSFCTPVLQRPLQFGAHLVVHTATKYLDGQGRFLGGAVVGDTAHIDEVRTFLRAAGPSMSPMHAWTFLKSLETLPLRMAAHSRNALRLARWLDKQDAVQQVYYAGLPDHPRHQLAQRQQKDFGGVVTFRIPGGRQAAWRFIDATRLFSLTANLGDTKSTIVHPATTTHHQLSDQERSQWGISEGLIRISAGLEDPRDLQKDLQRGLAAL